MQTRSVLDVSQWSRFNNGKEAPIWWGILGLILVEAMVVAGFISSYLYLSIPHAEWPPYGLPAPELPLPTLALLLLLSSCYTMYLAGRYLDQGRPRAFMLALLVSIGLASMVLILRWIQFHTFEFRWSDHAYGSLVWTLTGFHFIHVVSMVIGTSVIALLGFKGFFSQQRQLAVVVDTLYWYFVALIWIPLYLLLYWLPRCI